MSHVRVWTSDSPISGPSSSYRIGIPLGLIRRRTGSFWYCHSLASVAALTALPESGSCLFVTVLMASPRCFVPFQPRPVPPVRRPAGHLGLVPLQRQVPHLLEDGLDHLAILLRLDTTRRIHDHAPGPDALGCLREQTRLQRNQVPQVVRLQPP